MKETFILAPGANSAELLRTLAKNGFTAFNVRVTGSAELAKDALARSGKAVTRRLITPKEQCAVYCNIISDIAYFGAASYSDAENLSYSIDSVRCLIPENERRVISEKLPDGEFPEKNEALIEAYRQYMDRLDADGTLDGIGLIREAVEKAEPIQDADFIALEEFPLSPLDGELLDKLSGGRYRSCKLYELIGKSKAPVRIESYTDAFGSANEAEAILGKILENNIPLDQCTVAVTDIAKYGQLFYDVCGAYGIPVTFGCGVPITNSYPALLLRYIGDWCGPGLYSAEALNRMIFSPAFDRNKLIKKLGCEIGKEFHAIIQTAGDLRLSFDASSNADKLGQLERFTGSDVIKPLKVTEEIAGFVKALSGELKKGYIYLLKEYSVKRWDAGWSNAGRIDVSALSAICQAIEAYPLGDDSIADIIPAILKKNVCRENSAEGCLYVTDINGAICAPRENLFIAGLNANIFPGRPSENYLLLDSDYGLFTDENVEPQSERIVNYRKKALDNLVKNAAAMGSKIHISYTGFDCAELKRANPSSSVFSLFRDENGRNVSVKDYKGSEKLFKAGFFAQRLGANRLIGREYAGGHKNGTVVTPEEIAERPQPRIAPELIAEYMNAEYYPTQIEKFISCPKRFYLRCIAGLHEPDSEVDIYSVIDPAATGDLAHAVMEAYSDSEPKMDEERFIAFTKDTFESFLKKRLPANPYFAGRDKKQFIEMMTYAFNSDPGGTVLAAEEKLQHKHSSGINLCGYPDRIEKFPGRCTVADYKTGYKVKHIENDFESCAQALMYACLAENTRDDIDSISDVEFRYLRDRQTVRCDYNDGARDYVSGILDKLSSSITGLSEAAIEEKFPINPCGDACEYCRFGKICGKENTAEEAGDDDE